MTPERSGGRAKFLSRAGVRSGQLDGWTPIALDGVGPTQLVWADLHDRAFNAPFFTHIIDAWRRDGAKDAVRTDLSALPTQDPALDPDLIIAHPSRTGSTLLARLAAAEAGSILVSEPGILSGLLERHLAGTLGAPIGPTLQAVVRAQGRRRPAEQRYILKLNSQGRPLPPRNPARFSKDADPVASAPARADRGVQSQQAGERASAAVRGVGRLGAAPGDACLSRRDGLR